MLFVEIKVGGDLHLFVNYHALIAITVADAWPFWKIHDLLSQIQGARVFSSLDLWNGYHKIPIDPAD